MDNPNTCETCGGRLDREPYPLEDGLPPMFILDGTCAPCAFEAAADAAGATLEDLRQTHGALFFANPGIPNPDDEAAVLAENARIEAELANAAALDAMQINAGLIAAPTEDERRHAAQRAWDAAKEAEHDG